MSGTTLLLNLAGAIALLLWGTHMISTALLRGFGTQLRNWMGRNLNNRWMALISGIGITGVLQSPEPGPGPGRDAGGQYRLDSGGTAA